MLVRLFKCRNCGSIGGHVARPRTFGERYILPLLFLRPVRCGDCSTRYLRSRFVLVQERGTISYSRPECARLDHLGRPVRYAHTRIRRLSVRR